MYLKHGKILPINGNFCSAKLYADILTDVPCSFIEFGKMIYRMKTNLISMIKIAKFYEKLELK